VALVAHALTIARLTPSADARAARSVSIERASAFCSSASMSGVITVAVPPSPTTAGSESATPSCTRETVSTRRSSRSAQRRPRAVQRGRRIVRAARGSRGVEVFPMCMRVDCPRCKKATYAGCGRHVEQVLGAVPAAERCRCNAKADPPSTTDPRSPRR
jgi:hypothetical protein